MPPAKEKFGAIAAEYIKNFQPLARKLAAIAYVSPTEVARNAAVEAQGRLMLGLMETLKDAVDALYAEHQKTGEDKNFFALYESQAETISANALHDGVKVTAADILLHNIINNAVRHCAHELGEPPRSADGEVSFLARMEAEEKQKNFLNNMEYIENHLIPTLYARVDAALQPALARIARNAGNAPDRWR